MRSKNFTGNLLYIETVRSCKPLATLRSTSYGHVTGSSEQWKVVKAKHTFAPMTVTFLYLLFLIPANRLLASVITRFDECIVGESKPRFGTVTGTSKKWMVVKANITLAPVINTFQNLLPFIPAKWRLHGAITSFTECIVDEAKRRLDDVTESFEQWTVKEARKCIAPIVTLSQN